MKTKNKILTMLFMLCILFLATATLSWAEIKRKKDGCFSMDGRRPYKCGQSWSDSYKGVVYDCTCNCSSTGQDCKPRASASGKAAPKIGGLGGAVGSEQFAKDMVMNMGINLIGMMIENAINPQQNNAANAAAAAAAYQEALAKKKKQEHQERIARFKGCEDKFADKRKKDKLQLDSILGDSSSFDVAGSNDSGSLDSILGNSPLFDVADSNDSGSLDGFLGVLENELQPRGTANYDTSALSLSDRIRCAAYFSNSASAAAGRGDHVNARYLNEQAQKAMLGQITDEECQFSALPDIPDAPTPQPIHDQKETAHYESMINAVQQDVKKLQNIDIKLKETDEKIKQAEEKKQQAEQKITELQNRAASDDKPEDKQEYDDLEAQARQLEQEAQQQIQTAIDDKQNYLNEKENITNKLKEVQKSMQQSSGSN